MMIQRWLRFLRPPRAARGIAVMARAGIEPDPEQLRELLARCEALRRFSSDQGIELTDDARSLDELDGHLDTWVSDPEIAAVLGDEVACYLGSVIVREIEGAHWRSWPNGQPVVRLADGRAVDVVALAARRLSGGPSLGTVFRAAQS